MKSGVKFILWLCIGLFVLFTAAAIDIRPQVTLENGTVLHIEYGDHYDDSDVKAGFREFFSGYYMPAAAKVDGEVDSSTLGQYEVTYSLGIGLWKSMQVRTVIIEDTQPPVITLTTDPDAYTVPGEPYEEEGYNAADIHDGDLTDKVVAEEKDGKVTYTVTDSSGNVGTAVREIHYYDPIGPEIKLTGGDMTIVAGNKFFEQGYSATDNLDGDLTDKVEVSGDVDTDTVGAYTVTYRVKDSFDNEAIATRTINVIATGKTIYLTFDDGPYKYTEKLLDVLDEYEVKATFFVTNQYPSYIGLIGEEARRGHTVAVHTYTHEYSDIYSGKDAYYADLNKMNDIIQQQTGSRTNMFRFPGGSSNGVSKKYCTGIMTELTKSLPADGYYYYDWNVSSGDAGETIETDQVVANVIAGCEGRDASVVLQHDIKEFSVDAVEEILKWGLSNGYTFEKLTPASPGAHHSVNN